MFDVNNAYRDFPGNGESLSFQLFLMIENDYLEITPPKISMIKLPGRRSARGLFCFSLFLIWSYILQHVALTRVGATIFARITIIETRATSSLCHPFFTPCSHAGAQERGDFSIEEGRAGCPGGLRIT